MVEEKPQRRLLRLLRRKPKGSVREAEDQNALWSAHERATSSAREVSHATSRIASTLSKQRVAMEAVSERARTLVTRSSDLSQGLRRIQEAFERLGLVALNASLEGTRQAESIARPLLLVGDEVRNFSSRGGELSRELESLIADVQAELLQLSQGAEQANEASTEVTFEVARAGGASATTERVLIEAREHLKRATGTDPETMKVLAEAAEHARALVLSLGTLSGRVPQGLLASVLRPAIEPLLRLLTIDEDDDASP
jgi:methyl-accepting chemotaxis protein